MASARLPRYLARSVLAAWAVVAVELVVVVAVRGDRFGSIWELQYGTLWLAPTVLAAAAAVGLAGATLLWLVERAPLRVGQTVLATAGLLLAGVVAWGVGGGRHLETLATRGGFTVGVALLAAGLGAWVSPKVARTAGRAPARLAAWAAAIVLGAELSNRFVLVRLYPAFHLGLALVALLVAPALGRGLGRRGGEGGAPHGRRAWTAPVLVAAVVVGASLVARPAAAKLAYFDNYRLLLVEQAPLLGHAVQGAALLAKPAPLGEPSGCEAVGDPDCSADGSGRRQVRTLDLRGRDLLLITIDALRADHVGSYGYVRSTTPNLDRLARESAWFEHAYCPTPHTSYSVTSMMTGKYLRPLLLQGAGEDSDTWADLLRTYGYRTAAFYPPAVFFIDASRFEAFRQRQLGFEYAKVEFLEGEGRVEQLREYLDAQGAEQRLFVWVHLFGPHEPYEAHGGFDFGTRDVDRYDSEIAAADATVGQLVDTFRRRRPTVAIIVSADHGEEFGDHGGRYHGTTVYEEQVRVPLLITAPGAVTPNRVSEPVQTIDLLPTVLASMDIPIPARVRGRDLGPLLARQREQGTGFAFVETEEQAMLAEGPLRLICARRLGACRLFDVVQDPVQGRDLAGSRPDDAQRMKERLHRLAESHGRYEARGIRAEGRHWPSAIVRGMGGEGDAAPDVAALLDDADREIRAKAAQVLFDLRHPDTAPALRLALQRDEDSEVRRWCALALTRMGQGAPLVYELAKDDDATVRRLAALALAESGDRRGWQELVRWWMDDDARDYRRSRELLDALGKSRPRAAVWPLLQSLGDVRLRPHIARTLAAIGDPAARGGLSRAFAEERYQGTREAIARALVDLGADFELVQPLVRFLGVPDPLPGGLGLAAQAKILEHLGGPSQRQLRRLQRDGELGVALDLVVPHGGNGRGVRVMVRARSTGQNAGQVIVGLPLDPVRYDREGRPVKRRKLPVVDPERQVRLRIEPGGEMQEVHAVAGEKMGLAAGRAARVVVVVDREVELEALALVPLADELPPPPPRPWRREPADAGAGEAPVEDAGAPLK